ncbi:MAG TPA: protein kinase [Candidatus Baltobacteraceae bacterium]|nr:protein kinase [Candidatus Baltobacteraceae bacterium]
MPSPQNREEVLLAAALGKLPAERASFLDGACYGDPALRQRLEVLLAAHDKPDQLPPSAAPAVKATIKLDLAEIEDEAVGKTIGRYKVLEKVGEGGCGVVYVAEQTEPVRRRVALKVIKLGMDTKQVVARFEAERQALAMMDHPNIAKVLDAGATETGRPYFVMELVRGIKITDYCDQATLTTKERLDLFMKVCQAIQHAHQKGIIHRDIKPSNILVTLHDGVPVPKVIDFGIAKATEGRLTDATVYTQLHQFIGTPAYMSPEQAEMSGLDIDTRSDTYSLGVLLYELLTGSTPFDAQELIASGMDAMRKTIREKEPVRPSTRLATLGGEELTTTAKRRSVDKSKLLHQLRGDLDWIVMKCLEKDRTRRYDTANGLAFDLKRHLDNEPVLARPPSAAYRFQKAFRRNKLVFAAGTAVVIALAGGLSLAAIGLQQAIKQRNSAQAARANEEAQRRQAQQAEANEAQLRAQAQAQELAARRRAYALDMISAMQALDQNNLGRALEVLNRQKPAPGQKDLRGWEWRYLWGQSRSDALLTLCQKSNDIHSLTVSADGTWLAIGTVQHDGLSVWDLRTHKEVDRLATNERWIRAAFSPKEPLLAFVGLAPSSSGVMHATLHLWNAVTRTMLAEVPMEELAPCEGLTFSTDGQTLVTSLTFGSTGRIALWRIPQAANVVSYPSGQFSPDFGTPFAATGDLRLAAYAYLSETPQLRLVDLRNGKDLWSVPSDVIAVAFSPDGKTVASGTGLPDPDIALWDVASGKEIGRLKGHNDMVTSLMFWPDGKKLASSSADETVRIWDVASRTCLDTLRGHGHDVRRLTLMPDNRTLVTGDGVGGVCFWDTSVNHPRSPGIAISANALAWCFAPDSQSILTLDQRGTVVRWIGPDFRQSEPIFETDTNLIRYSLLHKFSDDGRFLCEYSTNGLIQVWDVARRLLWRQWTNTTSDVIDTQDGMIVVGFLPKGNGVVTWSARGNMLHEWDFATDLEKQSWRAPQILNAWAFSPNNQLCAIVGYHGDLVLRKLADQTERQLDLNALWACGAAFSPDGKLFALARYEGSSQVWDTATWHLEPNSDGITAGPGDSVAFSPDGKRLAVLGNGNQVLRLWDTQSWQQVITLEGQPNKFPTFAAFSPDGNIVGTMDGRGVVQLWRAPSWEQITATEVKDSPSPSYDRQGKEEIKQP